MCANRACSNRVYLDCELLWAQGAVSHLLSESSLWVYWGWEVIMEVLAWTGLSVSIWTWSLRECSCLNSQGCFNHTPGWIQYSLWYGIDQLQMGCWILLVIWTFPWLTLCYDQLKSHSQIKKLIMLESNLELINHSIEARIHWLFNKYKYGIDLMS